ncbi:MAG: hypothetical protein M3O46_06630 [Myxococcota bacterium]|nr:hypothetical protein [Myxococcota bacterium]
MKKTLRSLGFLSVFVVGLSCTKMTHGIEPSDASTPAVIAIPPAPASGAASQPILTLGDKLVFESTHRTAMDTPKAEDVYAALEKAGFKLTEKQQHVASVFGAQYCLGAKTENAMAFSVCEYSSPEEAESGRETSLKTLATVPNREIHVNRKTTLTIRQPAQETSASKAAAKSATDIFSKL